MPYPDFFLRGILNNTQVDENGCVKIDIFQFNENPNEEREFLELSINWYDNDESLDILFQQKKDNGEIIFKFGAAKIPLFDVDRLRKKNFVFKQFLHYERSILENNQYHGNLLLSKQINKSLKNQVRSYLALMVEEIMQNELF